MVFPPSQVFGAEYFANDRVGVVEMAHGHVHLSDHPQLLARHLDQLGVGAVDQRRAAGGVVVQPVLMVVAHVARRRAVGPVQPVMVRSPLQLGRRVRPVAALVRRTVVRVDHRVRRVVARRRGPGGRRRRHRRRRRRRHRCSRRAHVRVPAAESATDRRGFGFGGRVVDDRDGRGYGHRGRVPVLVRRAPGAARTARATLPRRRVHPQIVRGGRAAHPVASSPDKCDRLRL